MRNNHREDDKEEYKLASFELELRKTVADYTAHKCLDNAAENRQHRRVQKCCEIIIFLDDSSVSVKRRIFRYQLNRYIDEVLTAHK